MMGEINPIFTKGVTMKSPLSLKPLSVGGLLISLALLTGLFAFPWGTHASGPYVVNVSYDGPDSNLGDGVCSDGVAGCTLRAAIEQASADFSTTTITFDSSLAGATLMLSGAYGPIVWAGSNITLDGESQNIAVSGELMNSGQSMFQMMGDDNTLTSLTIKNSQWDGIQIGDFAGVGAGNRNLISNVIFTGNTAAGIFVIGSASGGGVDNVIQSNVIGVGSWGATACVSGEGNGQAGIYLAPGAHHTLITGNRLVCNQDGVIIFGSSGSPEHVDISYNDIGGHHLYAMGNAFSGIIVTQANNTLIYENMVSGNGDNGIVVEQAEQTYITGNVIGTDAEGNLALPNAPCGINLIAGATNTQIGGSLLSERNIISGNAESGVCINGGSNNNTINGNLIGLNSAGNAAIPNGHSGIAIRASDANSIGSGYASSVTQFISGNTLAGIYLENTDETHIQINTRVGVGSDDAQPLGNGQEGILLNNATRTTLFALRVVYNGGAGVAVVGESALDNRVGVAEVHQNGGLPLDLGNDGFTPNGSHLPPGPNSWLPYPLLTTFAHQIVSGTACNNCIVILYKVVGDPTTPGGGGIYLGEAPADAAGHWSKTLPAGNYAPGFTAVACEAPCTSASNTSEMSPRLDITYTIALPLVIR
jgi:parallel beta-helix repeat protein